MDLQKWKNIDQSWYDRWLQTMENTGYTEVDWYLDSFNDRLRGVSEHTFYKC